MLVAIYNYIICAALYNAHMQTILFVEDRKDFTHQNSTLSRRERVFL